MKNTQYLHCLKGRYYCRIRWPKEVQKTLGNGAFKAALGTSSREEAIRRLPAAMQEFQNKVNLALERQRIEGPRKLGEGEISLLVAQWVKAVAPSYKTSTRPRQMTPKELKWRENFDNQRRAALDARRKAMGRNDYTALNPILDGLLARNGLDPDRNDESYGILCRTLMRAWQVMEEQAFAETQGDFGHQTFDPILSELENATPTTSDDRVRTIGQLLSAYHADRSAKWSKSTSNAYKPVFRLLKDCLGENRDVRSVNREAAREVFEIIKKLPANLGKDPRLAGLTVPAAIAVAEELGIPSISAKTMNDTYLAHTSAIFKWAAKEQWLPTNSFEGLRVHDDTLAESKRDPFTDEHLKMIFGSAHWAIGDQNPNGKPSLYWGPLFCMYHGLRVGEPAGLLMDEILERDGVPTIRIQHNSLRRVKNNPTQRYLPIHPEIIRLGFLEYVQAQRAAGHKQVFPEAKLDGNGHVGDHITDWLSRHLTKLGIKEAKLTTHSFRHTFEDKLREASIFGTVEGAILDGRQQPVSASATAYGNGYKMKQLLGHLEALPFPDLGIERPQGL